MEFDETKESASATETARQAELRRLLASGTYFGAIRGHARIASFRFTGVKIHGRSLNGRFLEEMLQGRELAFTGKSPEVSVHGACLFIRMSGTSLTAPEALSIDFWRELCPALTIERSSVAVRARLPPVETLSSLIATEGYVHEPGVFSPEDIASLRDCVLKLHQRGISPGFAFVYDQFWTTLDGLSPYLSAILGEDYRLIPAFWAWCVEPSNDAAGWKAHRDRPNSRDVDGRPQSLTVWLPLTDTTPLNGCMYLLPAHLDPDIVARRFDGRAAERFTPETLQNIRALPAPAGSLLSWHQEVLHWGARASVRGGHPRISLSHEFQRGDVPPFASPLLCPGEMPSFHARLGWIGMLFGNYAKHQKVGTPETRVLAAALERKFAGR